MISKFLIYLYLVAALGFTFVTNFQETQPALFWIDIFAPEVGDAYNMTVVGLLTFLTLLLPLLSIMTPIYLITKAKDAKAAKNVDPNQTGIWVSRKSRLQKALIGIPIYINDKKEGTIYNGTTKFFPFLQGKMYIKAGKGKYGSEELTIILEKGMQARTEIELIEDGMHFRVNLKVQESLQEVMRNH